MESVDNFFVRWLPLVIRFMALGFLVFFAVLGLHSLGLADFGAGYLSLVRWGSHGEAYELMICTIYLVWSIFLCRCADHPLQEKTFLDFTMVANVAHFGVMFLQGLFLHGEHQHLFGDILLGWSGLILFIVFWIPSRRFATQGFQS